MPDAIVIRNCRLLDIAKMFLHRCFQF